MRYTQFRENHRNWVYLTHFPTVFHVFGLVLAGKPVGSQVRVPTGSGTGRRRDTRGLPVHLPNRVGTCAGVA